MRTRKDAIPLRRKDRETTDQASIEQIIQACDCCRLAFTDESAPYIVPLNFGSIVVEGRRRFYFHGAHEGRKMTLLCKHPVVGFELDTNHQLHTAETACGYSYRFSSVIGAGRVTVVESREEKLFALQTIMRHYSERDDWPFTEAHVNAVTVLRLDVDTLACKEHA